MSHAQDLAVGDGTTGVVLLAGAMILKAHYLLQLDFHPNIVQQGLMVCMIGPVNLVAVGGEEDCAEMHK